MAMTNIRAESARSNTVAPMKPDRRDAIIVAIVLGICVAAPYSKPSTEKFSATSSGTTFVRTPETPAPYPAPSHEVRP